MPVVLDVLLTLARVYPHLQASLCQSPSNQRGKRHQCCLHTRRWKHAKCQCLAKAFGVSSCPMSPVRWVLVQKCLESEWTMNIHQQVLDSSLSIEIKMRKRCIWRRPLRKRPLWGSWNVLGPLVFLWYDYQYCWFGNAQRRGIDFDRLSWIVCTLSYPSYFQVAFLP